MVTEIKPNAPTVGTTNGSGTGVGRGVIVGVWRGGRTSSTAVSGAIAVADGVFAIAGHAAGEEGDTSPTAIAVFSGVMTVTGGETGKVEDGEISGAGCSC